MKAAKDLGSPSSITVIRRVCRGEGETSLGYKWRYATEEEIKTNRKDIPEGKPYPKFPGYIITRDGRVWSEHAQKLLKFEENGYVYVNLKGSKLLHRIVAETYLPNPKKLPQVNHKDGDKMNNSVDN